MKMSETCQGCGSAVSNDFARVCGDNNGKVYHCMNCITREEGGATLLRTGGAAFEDLDEAKRRLNL